MLKSFPLSYVFFGTGALAESVLASLVKNGYIPKLIVTKPDAPQGRHMHMTAPHIKVWAEMNGIKTFQPESLENISADSPIYKEKFDIFIVASYGKIIPGEILNIPQHGTLNVHPSLLPEYRGASPIPSALLDGKTTIGVSIMKLDDEMDHGPILIQTAFQIDKEATAGTLEVSCGQLGGDLLSKILPDYIEGNLVPKEQEHLKATVCKKIVKTDGEIKFSDSADDVRRKFRALSPWPGIYFFILHKGKQMRVKITGVDLVTPFEGPATAKDVVASVIPEGKHEITWGDFEKGYLK